jgi:hypothetical protein
VAVAPEPYLSACLETLYHATLEARMLGMTGKTSGIAAADATRLDDLMDAVHSLPRLLTRWEKADERWIRDCLTSYDEKWAAVSSVRLLAVYEGAIARTSRGG